MLNQSNQITLTASAGDEKTIDAMYVIYSFQPVGGKVIETIDNKLDEDYNGHRKEIAIEFWADTTLSNWIFSNFLPSTTKKITIDGTAYDVVVRDKKITFKHVKKNNYLADIRLNLAVKTPE